MLRNSVTTLLKAEVNESNPSLQGTGHLVDRTLQGVVRCLNEKEKA